MPPSRIPGERGEDRDRQEPSVDGRVPEDGVDAEERRVGVEHLHARVPEDVAGQPLVAADRGERERHRDQPAPEPREPLAAPGEPREADREQPEGEHEGAEEDRAAAHVDGPRHREPRPEDERGEGPGDRPELARAVVAAHELPRERQGEPADHAVEGEQEVDLVVPDVDGEPERDAGEGGEGERVRPAPEHEGDDDRDDGAADRRRDEPGAAEVGEQVEAEDAERRAPRDEPCEPGEPVGREEQHGEPGGSDDRGDLRGGRHGAGPATTTAARSTWPFASISST